LLHDRSDDGQRVDAGKLFDPARNRRVALQSAEGSRRRAAEDDDVGLGCLDQTDGFRQFLVDHDLLCVARHLFEIDSRRAGDTACAELSMEVGLHHRVRRRNDQADLEVVRCHAGDYPRSPAL